MVEYFFDVDFIDNLKSIYRVYVLEVFLQSNISLLRGFSPHDEPVLIKDKFRYYGYNFVHFIFILYFTILYSIDENIWLELYHYRSFLNKVF